MVFLFGLGGDFGILWLFFDDLFDDRLLNGDGINLLLDLNGNLLNDINALEFLLEARRAEVVTSRIAIESVAISAEF